MPPNPFTPPPDLPHDATRSTPKKHRIVFLLLPPLIPFIVHFIARFAFPPLDSETLYHALFSLGPLAVAWIWAQSMLDRMHLSLWKSFLLACFVWSMILASSVLSHKLWSWTFG